MTNNRKLRVLTSIVCLIPIVVGFMFYSKMPEQVAIHWGFDGKPDGYASKVVAIVVLPLTLFVVNLLLPFLFKMDPKYENISEKTVNLSLWILPVVSLMASGLTIFSALGKQVNVNVFAPLVVGIMFTVIGNYLPKMSQSYTVGIKLPWTLNDEENWNKTHRLAGKLWVACGLLLIIGSFTNMAMGLMIAMLVVAVIVPTVYSYMQFKNTK